MNLFLVVLLEFMSKLYRLSENDLKTWNSYKKLNSIPDWFESYSDGCTCAPDLNITLGCLIHDWDYYIGGSIIKKLKSDLNFFLFVYRRNHPFVALIYYLGVSVFGLFLWNYKQKK
jgi:hypothetical protein